MHTRKFAHYFVFFLALSHFCITPSFLSAKEQLPIPRFVSIKASEANLRTGPNVRYPVRWVFVKKGEPVEVNAEFEQWRKIKDKQGDEGWMHESMLSGQRYIIVEGNAEQALVMYRKPDLLSKPVAMLTPEVRAELKECQSDWCRIETHNVTGWIEKQHIWGVYKHEIFD